MNEKSFSDIQTKTWFDRMLPVWAYPYARLARWDRPVGVWLLFLPCLWGVFFALSPNAVPALDIIKYIALFFMGSVTMRGAGCTINDLWDQKMDAQVERTKNRPLPSGQLSRKQAVGFLLIQVILGAIVLFQFSGITIFVGLLSLPLVVLYPLMKRWTWWPQAFLGITFNWGILMGASSIMGGISAGVFMLYLGAVMWTIAYDTIYAFQDLQDDAMIGVRSTARLFQEKTKPILIGFYSAMALFFVAAGWLAHVGFAYYGLVVLMGAVHIMHLLKYWDMNSQPSSLIAFKRHIAFGWGIAGIMLIKFALTV